MEICLTSYHFQMYLLTFQALPSSPVLRRLCWRSSGSFRVRAQDWLDLQDLEGQQLRSKIAQVSSFDCEGFDKKRKHTFFALLKMDSVGSENVRFLLGWNGLHIYIYNYIYIPANRDVRRPWNTPLTQIRAFWPAVFWQLNAFFDFFGHWLLRYILYTCPNLW